MRPLLYALVAVVTTTASAQSSFRLSDPALFLDDQRVVSTGAPFVQQPFGILTIDVPGNGTFAVSDRPFEGSSRAGLFDGRGLFFHAGDQNVRVVSRVPILSQAGPITAYARFTPTRSRRSRGLARLDVVSFPGDPGPQRFASATAPPPRTRRAPQRRTTRRGVDHNQTAPRPAARYLRDAEAQRLAVDLDRYEADRQRLAAERDRVARAQAPPIVQRVSATTSGASDRLALLAADRDRLAVDRDRLLVERDQLKAALSLAEAERDRLAAEFAALRRRAEDAEARAAGAGRTRSDFERVEGELVRLRAEQDELRAQIQTRDQAIVALTSETRDRDDRLPAVEAQLAETRRQLADAVLARDRALADRDVAYTQRDAAIAQRDGAYAERDGAIAEADRLRVDLADARADRPTIDLSAERAALARDRALLDADRAALNAEREALAAARAEATVTPDLLDERLDLITELSATQAEREALMSERTALVAERAALIAERDRLAAELARRDAAPPPAAPVVATPTPTVQEPSQTIRTPAGPEGALAFLPGFDFARLQNPDVVRRRLDEAEYPRWATVGRIEGDVLVLFQTDPTGRVIRTAVPTPIGGGLDALAEEIVREMRFVPPTVDGQSTGLRSQVVIRFEL